MFYTCAWRVCVYGDVRLCVCVCVYVCGCECVRGVPLCVGVCGSVGVEVCVGVGTFTVRVWLTTLYGSGDTFFFFLNEIRTV